MATAKAAIAKELLDAGKLQPAIEELISYVKKNPTDIRQRTFLFELLCFSGCWERAENQLEVLGLDNVKAEVGVLAYHNNIAAEKKRLLLFSEGLQPNFLLEPPAYIYQHLAALNKLRDLNLKESRRLLDEAEEVRPALSGRFNEKAFQDLRDYEDLIAPVLELFLQDRYIWLPFEQIRRIEIAPPKQLRDLLWATARVETLDNSIGEVYLPTLYTGSSEHPDDQVKLGRMTDWTKISDDFYLAAGLHMFQVDSEGMSILEAKTIEFDSIPGTV
jgi:type VI secretion system protein ImpE